MSGRRVLPEETLRALYEAFRTRPGHIASAWRTAGVNYRTAQKAWEEGFPGRAGWERPMSEMILEEQEAARARIRELEATIQAQAADLEARRRAEERAKAVVDATETRVQEGQLIRMARSGAMGLLKTLNTLTYGTVKIGARMKDALDALADRKDPVTGLPVALTPAEMGSMIKVCTGLSDAMKKVVETGQTAMEMERLLLGEPQKIVGHQQLEEMTLDQAKAELLAGQRAIERATRRQALAGGGEPASGSGGGEGVAFQTSTGLTRDGSVH